MTDDDPVLWLYMRITEHEKMKKTKTLARVAPPAVAADRLDLPRKSLRGSAEDYDETCDGCAQARSECLCDVDLRDVLDCNHPSHPGCRHCEVP
jgi:hypothetical protein